MPLNPFGQSDESGHTAPYLASAVVIGYDPVNYRLNVALTTGEALGGSIAVLCHGPSDPFAKNMPELPRRGTRGVVAFLDNNPQSGVWLGSYDPSLSNANPNDSQSPFNNYFAHWNGGYEFEDMKGQRTRYFTDGTTFQMGIQQGAGQPPLIPSLNRNIFDGSNPTSTVQAFTNALRNPNPQAPFSYYISFASGATALWDYQGSLFLKGPANATASLNFHGTKVDIDSSGNVVVTLSGSSVMKVTGGNGALQVNGNDDALALVSKLVTWLSNHVHSGGTLSGSLTGKPFPLNTLTASDIASTSALVGS